ncbi:MAG: GGDEF domain-containing protein [Solirubrobacteraceae bacterium]|nr:GGDEF domain-containing protein [Solirubrobacteraceae bacterium]
MSGPARYSWICPDHASRARFITMHHRMLRVAQVTGLILTAALLPGLIGAPHPLLAATVIAIGLVQYGATQLFVPRFERPELWAFTSFIVLLCMITAGVMFAGRVPDGGMLVLVWPIIGMATRLPTRAITLATALAVGLTAGAWLATDAERILRDPAPLTVVAALLVTSAALVTTLRNSDAANHSAAISDPLTGTRNRTALDQRITQLEDSGEVSASGLAIIVLDIDHFKRVNDEHGHDGGDDVLRSVADTLAGILRPRDELYRLGGEEFVVLLPETAIVAAHAVAERLADAVRDEPQAACRVTISAGVAACHAGESFSWRRTYRRADTALYAAKEQGRDRVCIDGGHEVVAA